MGELPWRQEAITLFGRQQLQPRLQVWMGDPDASYRYSGTEFKPSPWHGAIKSLADCLSDDFGTSFNSVLCNLYQHGQHSMGWHSDDERELGPCPIIASVSLGAPRRFIVRRKQDHKHKYEYALGHGALLVMQGDTQRFWQHGIPKTARSVAPRINLTFRHILSTVG